MSEPNGYLIHGTAFSSKEAAFETLVHNHEQELRFHKLWDEDAQPYYFEPQPQLTIPKSIADEIEEKALDDYGVFQTLAQKKHIISDPEPFCDLSDEFISWCENNEKWWAIMNAYLAGKALGVDLVKVGEG